MSFRYSFIKQTQEYTITVANTATTGMVSVTNGEDLSYCTITSQGWTAANGGGGGGGGSTAGDYAAYLTVSGSDITAHRNGNEGALILKIEVTEYRKFAMLQAVQRGTIAMGIGGVLTADSSAYTATGSKAAMRTLGFATGASANVQANIDSSARTVKKDSTHATATRLGNSYLTTAAFEVVDWK